ncbi:hypothetical protein U9M48_043565 [Paspalum notatum var. saurae]|uniref:Integrase catalytic domain-containing protein n=1 Tax=Paspalum notatum var. saurae TaxID=547442 RepID=A0AAQ3UTR7_PASNO
MAPIKIKTAPTQPGETVDGVYHEPPKAAPKKIIEEELKPKGKKPVQQPEPPKATSPKSKSQPNPVHMRPVYHCEFCLRNGHLEEFCFRKKRVERQERAWGNQDQFYQGGRQDPPHRGEMRDHFADGERGGGFQARAPGGKRRFTGRDPSRFQRGYGSHDRGIVRELVRPRFEGCGYSSCGDFFDCAYPTFEQMARHWIDLTSVSGPARCLVASPSADIWKWHRRLGHLSFDLLVRLSSMGQIQGLSKLKAEKDLVCHPSRHSKMVAASHTLVSQVFFMEFEDGFVWDLVLRLRNESHKAMRAIRSDNGGEFRNSRFKNFCRDLGLEHQFSSPYTPQQNGVVERKNRTLVEMARTMLDDHKTPRRFWARQ